MAITADELLILIKARDEATKVFSSVRRNFATFGKDMARVGRDMTTKITLPIIGIGAGLFKMAADAVESENLFAEVMEDMADSTRAWSEELRDQLGLNDYEIREMTSTLYLMTSAMGIQEDAALDMSKRMTELAFDMASFRNLRVEEAFEKITAGITGEAEPLKRIGILVNEASTRQALLNANLIKGTEVLTDQQKIMGRYLAILQQTTKDTGDLARTLESPTNQLRLLISDFKLAAITLGTELMPEFRKLLDLGKDMLGWLKDAVKAFADLSREEQEARVKAVLLVAALGPLLVVVGNLAPAIILVGRAFQFAALQVTLFRIATVPEKIGFAAIGVAAIWAANNILKLAKAAREAKRDLQALNEAQSMATATGIELAELWNTKVMQLKDTNRELFDRFVEIRRELISNGVEAVRATSLAWSQLGGNAILAAGGVETAGDEIDEVIPKLEALKDISEALEPIVLSHSIAQQISSKEMRKAKEAAQALKDALKDQSTEYDALASTIRAAIETSEEEFIRLRDTAREAFGAGAISEQELHAYIAMLEEQLRDAGLTVEETSGDLGENVSRSLLLGLIEGAESKDLWDRFIRIMERYLVDEIMGMLFISSPSRLYEGIGRDMMLGLQKGINTNINLVSPGLGMAVGVGGGAGLSAPGPTLPTTPAPAVPSPDRKGDVYIDKVILQTGFGSKGEAQEAVRKFDAIREGMS